MRLTAGVDSKSHSPERGRRGFSPRSVNLEPANLSIPKNRSTGNLLAHGARHEERDRQRIRFSFDAGRFDYDSMSRLVASMLIENRRFMG
jgi:protein-serine/threonine kinase